MVLLLGYYIQHRANNLAYVRLLFAAQCNSAVCYEIKVSGYLFQTTSLDATIAVGTPSKFHT